MAVAEHSGLSKICTVCGVDKAATVENFSRNKGGLFGLRAQCRPCRNMRILELIARPETRARRQAANAEYVASGRRAAQQRAWRRANPKSALESKRKWQAANVEAIRAREQRWRDENRERVRVKQRRQDAKSRLSPALVLKKRIRSRLREMLAGRLSASTEALLGYTKERLADHIERQFTRGMTWERLLAGEIHIDHIVPVSAFSITEEGSPDFLACWALSNLRPMWAKDNLRKQAKVTTLL